MQPLTVTEASRASGISRGTLYRALNDGRLRQFEIHDGGKRRLHPGVVRYLKSGAIRPRVDSGWFGTAAPAPAPVPPVEPDGDTDGWLEPGDNSDLLPECWDDPDAGWEQFSHRWGRWEPGAELSDGEFWEHVAGLMRGWMSDPAPAITALTAPSWYMAASDAVAAVHAGYRHDPKKFAARAAQLDREFGVTDADEQP